LTDITEQGPEAPITDKNFDEAQEILSVRLSEEGNLMAALLPECPVPARAVLQVLKGIIEQLIPIAMSEEAAIREEKGDIIPATEADFEMLKSKRPPPGGSKIV